MSTLIHGGTVVAGNEVFDGGSVVLRGGRIVSVEARSNELPTAFDGEVVDAQGCIVMPGLVNSHTHGVTPGPMMPSAGAPLDQDTWMSNLDRHLLAGTTTVLNLCGLASMDEVREADRRHAVHVRGATTHSPSAVLAAENSDGGGLSSAVRLLTIERMIEDGAVAIGELGGGQTLGGGGQDLIYIPAAIEKRTGVRVSAAQARRMKEAALGRFIDVEDFDPEALSSAAQDAGLGGRITDEDLHALIASSVLPSFEPAIDGIKEGVQAALRYGVPAIVHSASATARVMRELMEDSSIAGAQVIAAHANHPSHTPREAYELAVRGREHGWAAEASVFDLLHRRHIVDSREHWDALLSEPGLVSMLATDYGKGGEHDELISAVQDVFTRGHRSLPEAVALATSAVAELIPGIAPNTGELRVGLVADVVVTDASDFRDVKSVFVDGECVVRDGQLTQGAHR